MFSRDIRHYQAAPRTLQSSKFGPYSRLSVEAKYNIRGMAWAIAYGVGVGIFFWLVVALRVGAQ